MGGRLGALLRLGLLVAALAPGIVKADETSSPAAYVRHKIIPPPKVGRSPAATPASSNWWMGTAGIALALAAFGGMSVAARKFLPQSESGPLRVLGRTSLSPKHAVYLLKAGDKVLIVGTGPQGSPTLLGEMPPESAPAPSPMFARSRAGSDA